MVRLYHNKMVVYLARVTRRVPTGATISVRRKCNVICYRNLHSARENALGKRACKKDRLTVFKTTDRRTLRDKNEAALSIKTKNRDIRK